MAHQWARQSPILSTPLSQGSSANGLYALEQRHQPVGLHRCSCFSSFFFQGAREGPGLKRFKNHLRTSASDILNLPRTGRFCMLSSESCQHFGGVMCQRHYCKKRMGKEKKPGYPSLLAAGRTSPARCSYTDRIAGMFRVPTPVDM